MIKVEINKRADQPDFWYINEISDSGISRGKIGYKSKREAAIVARQQHPYVDIDIQD